MEPNCTIVTKTVCEEKWIPEPPYWEFDEETCQDLKWKKCELVPHLINVTIDYCNCTDNEIWYNKLERVETQCVEEITSCVEKVVPVCKTASTQVQNGEADRYYRDL